MKNLLITLTLILSVAIVLQAGTYEELTRNFVRGEAGVQSMSVLTFGPEGILFIGDSRSGKVFAIDLEDREKNNSGDPLNVEDVERKVGSMLGVEAGGVIIHDLAVNPASQKVYLAVSRADASELSFWRLPNDINNATILLRVNADGTMEEVSLKDIRHSEVSIPNVIGEGPHPWRKTDKRTEAITDIAYDDGRLYVAGLSNEEFASSLRVIPFPFGGEVKTSTVEVWHVAHGKSETEAPIRTLLPYELDGQKYVLASYTCTPFVSIPVSSIKEGAHVKSKTLGEFGFGNMPVDIVKYRKDGKDFLMMSSNSKALIRIDPANISKMKKGLTEPLKKGQYTVGLPHDVWSVVGVTQIDNLNADYLIALQRMPNGMLNLNSLPLKYL